MPNNKKYKGVRSEIVQWFDKSTKKYQKIERATGKVLAEKFTAGPYKKLELVKRRPKRRTVKEAVAKSTVKKAVTKAVKVAKTTTVEVKPPKKVNYLNNKDLLAEVIASKKQKKMTDKLAKMLMMLCARYGRRGNFANYTYNEDMQAYAMFMLVRTWDSFDPAKSNNPFAFFTQCVKNSFIQYLNGEKRHRMLRDELMLERGLNPSYSYQLDHENRSNTSDDFVYEPEVDSDPTPTEEPEEKTLEAKEAKPEETTESKLLEY